MKECWERAGQYDVIIYLSSLPSANARDVRSGLTSLYMSFGQVGKTGWNPQCRGASKWCLSGRQKEREPQWPVYMSLCGGGCAPSRCCVTVLAEIETSHPARETSLAGSHRSQCHNLTCLRPEAGQQTVLGTGCCTTIEALGWVSFYLPLGWNHIPCPVFAAKSLRQYNSRISRLSWQTVFL